MRNNGKPTSKELGIVFLTPDHFAVFSDGHKVDYPNNFSALPNGSGIAPFLQEKTLETLLHVSKSKNQTISGGFFPWHDYKKSECLQNETFQRLFGTWNGYQKFCANPPKIISE